MSLRKQIDGLQAQRNKHLDAMTALSELSAGENRLFTKDEQVAFDKAQAEVADIDAQMGRLEAAERAIARTAQPAPGPLDPPAPTRAPTRAPLATPGVTPRAYVPFKGQGFVRMVLAVARTKGNMMGAADFAAQWRDQTPEVEHVLRAIAETGQMPGEVMRAAVQPGTTTNPTWAGPLVYAQNLASEFIEFLRPLTIIGRLPLRSVPFNVSIPRQTGSAGATWVGENVAKPVSQLTFDRLPIPWAKTAVICVITDELARFSEPSAEMLVRDDLVESIRAFLDQQFITPTVAPLANVRPGAITNGTVVQVPLVPSSGGTVAQIINDISALMMIMATNNLPMTNMRWVMTPTAKIRLAAVRTAQDLVAFPEVANNMLYGIPIVDSNHVPTVPAVPGTSFALTNLILMDCSQILHASDPVVDVTSSNEASLVMDNGPVVPATPLISLWQQNLLGIKAEQYQYWVRRRDGVVGMITGFPLGAGTP